MSLLGRIVCRFCGHDWYFMDGDTTTQTCGCCGTKRLKPR